MTVRTQEFALTQPEYFRIMLTHYVRRCWWLMALFELYACRLLWLVVMSADRSGWTLVLGILCLFFPLFIIGLLWRVSTLPGNRVFFKPKYYEADDTFCTMQSNDGTLSRWRWDDVTRVIAAPAYYALYVAPRQFVYVPVTSFVSPSDREEFERLLRARGLLRPAKRT